MSHLRLIYASRPFGFDPGTLNGVLLDSRRCNLRDDITGALITRADLFLQLLEGPPDKVNAAYDRIRRDDRHIEIRELVRRDADTRLFAGWAMRDDPARSWLWSREELAAGALDTASESEVEAVFVRVWREALN
ncbi:hypothetical protein P775_16165 [Puniceibacterium antarcticum]|uniref:BLUF domain-containing protein n=1 Tax=Puniceibacterium antarcticum TaxID=1206336 RepID=A0A2G8RC18_9RHOB|nr:BLUF domain-containing protein [Puniceibacterium antarcticum]PIL19115.1 hypothetical protein P775_16165 [Puniceibacterium antarcticum]